MITKLYYFNQYLTKQFRKLGICVAEHSSYFIIVPIFLSAVLGTGLQKWHENNNIKFLFSPDNTRHIKEEAIIQKLFPMDLSSNANMERMNREPCFANIIITAKDGGSVLRPNIFQEILLLDRIIQNITVMESEMKYKDLCAINNNKCFENTILLLQDEIANINEENYSIKYPLEKTGQYDYYLTSMFLGQVETDEDSNIKSAKAMSLFYYLNDESSFSESVKQWQSLFIETLASLNYKYLIVDRYTTISPEQELGKLIYRIFPRMPISMMVVILFSILTCIYNDWIESKPWTGVIALIAGTLSTVSSAGLIMYMNIPFIAAVGSIPFLILGIGMDDAFVLLAAWKRTDPKTSVSQRLGEAYLESGISVTITSVTNFIAFSSGIFTPYRIVRYFCLYATTAIFFCYVYQLTFIGACMAICGHLEKQNRHSLLFFQLENPKEKQTWIRRYLFTNEGWKSDDKNGNKISIWKKLGNILSLWPAKVITLLILTFHITIGFYGITKIDIVGKFKDSSATDSYLNQYFDNNFKYFSEYKFRFQIVIDENINYADVEIQRQVESIFSDLEDLGLIDDSLTESWLRSFLKFINDERISLIVNEYNMNSSEDFIHVLRRMFLRHPAAKRFRNDIRFNSNYTAIIGSRYLCQTLKIEDEDVFVSTFQKIRKITDNVSFYAFPYMYSIFWVDEVELHIKFTTILLSSISVILIIVCFIFVPDVVTILAVIFSVFSIEICALGYMAWWNVELAPVSIIILVMCAGFSVDYTAHLSHAFTLDESEDPNERLRNSINFMGLAIFQGSTTTMLFILPLAFPLAYIFVTAFKITFLVILFSAINALIFLPVLLASMYTIKQIICKHQ